MTTFILPYSEPLAKPSQCSKNTDRKCVLCMNILAIMLAELKRFGQSLVHFHAVIRPPILSLEDAMFL
jgi:hypothetical protein